MKLFKRLLLVVLGLAALGYAGITGYVYTRQGQIVYLPTHTIDKTPRDYGLAFEDVRLSVKRATGGTETIRGWWVPAPAPRGYSTLFLHGNARNMGAASNAQKVATLAKAGFNVLAIDYRGYGLSDGERPYEAAFYEDANAALDELERREPDAKKRVIHGHSLGGAVAIDLMVKRPEAKAVIVESSFDSMLGMSTVKAAYRLLPVGLILTERFDSLAKVPALKLPVLFIHGTADPLIPERMSERLFAAVPGEKQLVIVQGGHHSDLHTFPQYRDALWNFLGIKP